VFSSESDECFRTACLSASPSPPHATFLPPRHRHILEHSLEALVSEVRREVAADEPELAPHHLEHLFDFDKVESMSDESRQFPRRYLLSHAATAK
jgi:hypothetical protein